MEILHITKQNVLLTVDRKLFAASTQLPQQGRPCCESWHGLCMTRWLGPGCELSLETTRDQPLQSWYEPASLLLASNKEVVAANWAAFFGHISA